MENKITLVICLLMFIVAIFVGYNYIYSPQIQRIEDKKVQFVKEIEKNKIAYKIHGVRQKVDKYLKYFPTSSDASWLISEVSSKVKKADVDLLSIKPSSIKHFKDYDIISVILQLRGSFHNVGEFISKLESSNILLKVSSINVIGRRIYEREEKALDSKEFLDRHDNVIANINMEICTVSFP